MWPSSHKTTSISQFGNKSCVQTANVCSAANGNRLTARLEGFVLDHSNYWRQSFIKSIHLQFVKSASQQRMKKNKLFICYFLNWLVLPLGQKPPNKASAAVFCFFIFFRTSSERILPLCAWRCSAALRSEWCRSQVICLLQILTRC